MSKCCFCGKEIEYKVNGNDPRPIKVAGEEMPICCNECNARIVVPTRVAVWGMEKDLKEKLAEKEELKLRIKKLNKLYSEALETVDSLFTNQDKISFAVEQLEQVKKEVDCYMAIREGDLPYNIECALICIVDKIDNQIKQLKEKV